MRREEFLKYINDPGLLPKDSIPDLQKLVHDFPYFQAAHLLLSIASKKWDTSVYQQSLKKTAIVVSNRNHFYNLLHTLDLNEQELKEPENSSSRELNILKSAEIKTEEDLNEKIKVAAAIVAEAEMELPENKTETKSIIEAETVTEPLPKVTLSDEKSVEQEIKRSLVNSFVEKKILKTNEVFKSETPIEKPDNFSDWLQFLKKNNGQSYFEIEVEVNKEKTKTTEKVKQKEKGLLEDKEKKKALIDKIIEKNPGSIRQKEEQKFFKSDFKAKESLVENEHLVTETLAKIYALQGNIGKAVRAYEILSLKFPQKSAYFASLIQNLKNNP
ncbi:MAG: hypothetical protein HYX39_10970 [Bacteroidetes bacterium]|nr:hypothetical protein [Bacteroidota bacterium]